jgi:thioesterase domain-containing protein
MTAGEIEAYLHGHIPISAGMGVRVTACDETGVTLRAPLAPNINHRSTVFGGSASAVAILAAWTYLHFSLRAAELPSRLVIQRNTMDYLEPITGDFDARCDALPTAAVEEFLQTRRRHGKARVTLPAGLFCGGEKVAAFSGDYVAIKLA